MYFYFMTSQGNGQKMLWPKGSCWPFRYLFSTYIFINAEYFVLFARDKHVTATRRGCTPVVCKVQFRI
jgi:hypothetical protein